MNPNTNELINEQLFNSLKKNSPELSEEFLEVPENLQPEAKTLLGNNKSVIVPDDNKPLAKWAKKMRRKQNKRKKTSEEFKVRREAIKFARKQSEDISLKNKKELGWYIPDKKRD